MSDRNEPHIQEATAAARALRKRLRVPIDKPFDRDMLTVTEHDLGFAVTVMEMPDGVAGAYLIKRGQPFVFLKADDYPTRQRFTLAHEIGHHELGHDAVYESFKDIGRETALPHEQQANYFASELLAPEEAVRAWLDEHAADEEQLTIETLIHLADRFHISPPAMLYRLSTDDFGIPRDELTVMWDRVKHPEPEHVALSEEMGIGHGSDQLSRIFDAEQWPRLPGALEHNARALHEKGLIGDNRLAAVLRRS